VAVVGELPADRNLVRLFAAITDQRDVGFGYRGEHRQVAPHRLDYVRGRWYVSGHDHDRDATRHFRLDRIDGDVETGERSRHRRSNDAGPGVRLAPWELGGEPPVTARLLVDADQRPNALATARGARVAEERDDGSVVLELRVTNRAGFRSFVLGFLDHAEVLGPPELREDLIAWLAATIDRVEGRR
jgi:predicted DNA-binding transcriptional regulator YafY